MKKKVIFIVGPTASGKTKLGVEVAKKINGEIISADSMQIYRELDIATAKVTKSEKEDIIHHLIDICDVKDSFSVADFKNMCYDKIEEIINKEKVPVIVGGTGLYVNSVVYNMNFESEDIDIKYREELLNLSKKHSNEYVYEMLKKIDPDTANTIHPNNLKRVIRALEIAKNTEKIKSKHIEEEKIRIQKKDDKYDFYIFYIDYPRELLYERINKRVDLMIKQGVEKEAKKVYEMNLPKDNTCMQAIGYKEFFPYFEGNSSLEEVKEKLKQETRKYAKRQITWFNNKLESYKLEGNKDVQILVNDIIKIINQR
jgi:tRNA dimethylallyltransferase